MRHTNNDAIARPSTLAALAAAIERGETIPAPAPAPVKANPAAPAPFGNFEAMRRAYEAEQQRAVPVNPAQAAPAMPEPAPTPVPEKTAPAPKQAARSKAAAPDLFTCTVNAAYVYQAGKCRSEDAYADGLTGIRIEPAPDAPGVFIAGCNGHALVCMYDATGTASRPGTIYPDKTFLQAMKPKGAPGRLTVNDKAVGTLTRSKDMTIRQEQITHDKFAYPDIFNFLASARNATPFSGPLALPAMQLAALTCEGKTRGHVALYTTGKEKPIFIRDLNTPDYLGIIMPLKLHDEVYPGDPGNDKPQTALDNDTCPVPAWAVRAAGLDKAPLEKKTVKKPATAPKSVETAPADKIPAPVASAPAEAAPAQQKTHKARARVSIAANIASRKRRPAPPVETTAPASVPAAPACLPDVAAPAYRIAPAVSLVVAPAWMAHAFQMHA